MSHVMAPDVSITRSQETINKKCPGGGEWCVDSPHHNGCDRGDLDQARLSGPQVVAHVDRAREPHAGPGVPLVGDHEEVQRAEADLVSRGSGDVEEGGGEVVIAVEPPKERVVIGVGRF